MSGGPDIQGAAAHLAERISPVPGTAVVLGSGLGSLVDRLTDPVQVRFTELPGFPPAGVRGHAGRFVTGMLGERRVVLQAGRYHAYEGHPEGTLAAPTRLLGALGVRTLVLTNAAGGVRWTLGPGSLVLLDDHINLMGVSPLAGPVFGTEERFPDMSVPYDPELQRLALEAARDQGLRLERGVYAALKGPSYETPAEVRMLRALGADVIGMSTVPEVLTARAMGIRCVAFSLVTNRAAGVGTEPLSHTEVVDVGLRSADALSTLMLRFLSLIPEEGQPVGAK